MTRIRACEIIAICGIALSGYGVYAVYGYGFLAIVMGIELAILGLIGLLRA